MTGGAPDAVDIGARLLVWHVTETAGFESAWVTLDGLRLRAQGMATGQLPVPYSLAYELETDANAATTLLQVKVRTAVAERQLALGRDDAGWTVDGQPRPDLHDALDCDLACSPLTNTMPIVRHRLHRSPGARRFTMAFVQLPSLTVAAVAQQYEHLEIGAAGASVRYSSGDFTSDLIVDQDGFVVTYPTMARRLAGEPESVASPR